MFERILAPVDLGHLEKLDRAMLVTAREARQYGAPVTYVSVTSSAPTAVAQSPEAFRVKLAAFAQQQAATHGIEADILMLISHDEVADVDDILLQAVKDTSADLVIMASHRPGIADYFWPSNGGRVAAHTEASVFVVRDR